MFASCQVGNGATYPEDTVVGTGRELKAVHGFAQEIHSLFVRLGILLHQSAVHLCVAMDSRFAGKPFFLYLSGFDDALAYGSTCLTGSCSAHLLE